MGIASSALQIGILINAINHRPMYIIAFIWGNEHAEYQSWDSSWLEQGFKMLMPFILPLECSSFCLLMFTSKSQTFYLCHQKSRRKYLKPRQAPSSNSPPSPQSWQILLMQPASATYLILLDSRWTPPSGSLAWKGSSVCLQLRPAPSPLTCLPVTWERILGKLVRFRKISASEHRRPSVPHKVSIVLFFWPNFTKEIFKTPK